MLLLYNIAIRLYFFLVFVAAVWNKKARLWVEGRKNWDKKLSAKFSGIDDIVWMHCSSAGEFEQGKPLAEAIKSCYPQYNLLITFFSPSGYEAAKNYKAADAIAYLPLDTKKNARRFLEIIKPKLVIFIKYEFWYHHLSTAELSDTPLLLVSAVFRSEQIFFKSHGGFFRRMLHLFQHIFVQDETSLQMLKNIDIDHCSINGDTRFDRVAEIGGKAEPVPFIDEFLRGKKAVVAGSTWDDDEKLLESFYSENSDIKLIVVPHEVDAQHLRQLQGLFPQAALYSDLHRQSLLQPVPVERGPNWLSPVAIEEARVKMKALQNQSVLIINSTGLLSRLYQHATIAYVGGGFTRDGIHNVLEAAVWGKPVGFGPNYKKYREAIELIAAGGGFSVHDSMDFKNTMLSLLGYEEKLRTAGENAKAYVIKNTGATKKVMAFIQENRLLTKP